MVQAKIEIISQEAGVVTLKNASTNNLGAHSDISWCITQPKYTFRTGTTELAKFDNRFVAPIPIFKKGQMIKFSSNRNNINADYFPILEGNYVIILIARDTYILNGFTTSRFFYSGVEINSDNQVVRTYNNDEILLNRFNLLCNDAKSEEISAAKLAVQREAQAWFKANKI